MPNLVSIEPNPDYKAVTDKKPDAKKVAAYKAVVARGVLKNVAEATAMENIRQSGGMYRLVSTAKPVSKPVDPIEDMDRQDLILAAASLGIKIEKGTTQAALRAQVKAATEEIVFADDE
ncbi:hypothetical protein JANAI62_03720 [Jannaschia pagri]|uniref:Terminase small subunit n=1 Tax=Jannaschia pagri TaxID=2829797 RepID=A0ABQ4NHT3_9RHOB|nr:MULTISPECIES: hypothetical protein [unclassified Jannaschia]GIT90145.1 hypothetical protein JANAI61_06030 [Jannaschia sp. AI_61]GIT93749.1 hypothetical protein JANAI62_03720 [Jannaschia sp. AI_62]